MGTHLATRTPTNERKGYAMLFLHLHERVGCRHLRSIAAVDPSEPALIRSVGIVGAVAYSQRLLGIV